MNLLDRLFGKRSDEQIADLVSNSSEPKPGWYQAIDRSGVFIGYKFICTCKRESLIQGLAFFKNPVFKCGCNKVHDLNAYLKEHNISDHELPERGLVPRQPGGKIIEVGGWNQPSADDYEAGQIQTVAWFKA